MAEPSLPKSSNLTQCLLVILETTLALALGWGLVSVGASGGAWILGGIGAGALVFALHRRLGYPSIPPNRSARKLGQILVGLTAGLAIHYPDLVTLLPQFPMLILLSVLLLASSGILSYFYAQFQQTDLVTALLATTPGNIGIMASIAADYGKNPALVSLVQLLRFTAVTLGVPLLVPAVSPPSASVDWLGIAEDLLHHTMQDWLLLALILAVTFAVIPLGTAVKIPVATFFCAILVGLFFNVSLTVLPFDISSDFRLPSALNILGQILLGITIGEYWSSNPPLDAQTIGRAILPVVFTFGTGLFTAAIAHQYTDWDWVTCLLVAAPGGSPEMIWLATAIGHDVEIVTTGHLIRIMLINLLLPGLVSLALIWDTRLPKTNPSPEICPNASSIDPVQGEP